MTVHTFAMGDPQATFTQVMDVLARYGLLGADGRLRADARLVSMGDHFDYDLHDPVTAGREGVRVLRWLASHDPAQVQILLGNHDAARVTELAGLSDERFAGARQLAWSIAATRQQAGREAAERREREEFRVQFPDIATFGLAGRDYASFSAEQRALVVELLLAGRFRLALAGGLPDGREVLLTHAGVTARELALLGLADERSPRVLAAALNRRLDDAVERCRADWQRGILTPLPLAPLHVPGQSGEEGGGLLYHRPVCPERPGADPMWELATARPRRFDPRTLPEGLTQVVGHTGHRKSLSELGEAWPTPAARAHPRGGIRTLRVQGGRIVYDLGVLPPAGPGAAELIMIDGEMRHVSAAQAVLLPLRSIAGPAGG